MNTCQTNIRRKLLIIILILIATDLIMAGLVIYFSPFQRVKRQLSLGDKYLSEMNYDESILTYEIAIRIDPKREDAYVGLTKAYIEKEDYDKALATIERGMSKIGETDVLLTYKGHVEKLIDKVKKESRQNLREVKNPESYKKYIEPKEKIGIDDNEEEYRNTNLDMEKAMSKIGMIALLKEVVYCLDENGGYGSSYNAKDNDYWRIVNFFVVDDAYYRDIGMKKPIYNDSDGSLSYDEDSIKRIISALDPDFNGTINYSLVNRNESVVYDKKTKTFNFAMGDKGEVGSVLSGYIDRGNGKGDVYGNLYDWSEEKDFGGYCRIEVTKNEYAEITDDRVFPLSVDSARIISEDEYRKATQENGFVKVDYGN